MMPAIVQIIKHNPDNLVALALIVGPRLVERALRDTASEEPLVRYPATWAERERELELAALNRLMRTRAAGELGSRT